MPSILYPFSFAILSLACFWLEFCLHFIAGFGIAFILDPRPAKGILSVHRDLHFRPCELAFHLCEELLHSIFGFEFHKPSFEPLL